MNPNLRFTCFITKVLNDPNLKCLFKVFTLLANLELDDKSDRADESFKKMKISWSKMCRLSANLCQDNFPCVNIKDLYCKGKCQRNLQFKHYFLIIHQIFILIVLYRFYF
jgi:hypothetical protein